MAFDAARLRWDYEPQGYMVDGRAYLPDFYLPQVGCWVEIKPDRFEPSAELRATLFGLARGSRRRVMLLSGMDPECLVFHPSAGDTTLRSRLLPDEAVVAGKSARFEHGECG